jgi:hypothetical protein
MDTTTLKTKIQVALPMGYSNLDALLNSITTLPYGPWTSFNTNLRSGNPNSFFTIYTFKPLIGMTSQIIPANKITQYTLDNFGRLLNLIDQDYNVIQEYNYHYKE